MFRQLTQFVLKFKWAILLGLVLLTMLFADKARKLQIDPSTEPLFVKNSPEYIFYRQFTRQFGSDEMIALAMETPNLFTVQSLNQLKNLTEQIGQFKQVERVLSLANAVDIQHKFLGIKIVPALPEEVYESQKDANEIKPKILTNELYLNNLVSLNGKIANILIYLKAGGKDRESAGIFIKELRKLLVHYEKVNTKIKFYMAGGPIEKYDFIQLIRRDQFIFIPVITSLLILATWIIYRSFACMIVAMAMVFVTLIWALGTIVLMGQELNLVTSLLAPVIMIVSVANAIHLINLFLEVRPHHPGLHDAVTVTMSQLGAPCFLTHATTILGFISLAWNPVPAIRYFGIFAALGTFYSYVIELFLTPILLPILPYREPMDSFNEQHFFNRFIIGFLEKLEFRWKWFILAGVLVAIIFSVIGMTRLQVDTSLIKQMKPDSPLAISTRFIDENLTGVYLFGFVLEKKNGKKVTDYETLVQIDRFKNYLEAKPEIVKVNSITTLIKKINQAREGDSEGYEIPNDRERLKTYFEGIAASEDSELRKLVTPDLKQTRLEARMKAVGTREGAFVEQTVRQYLQEEMGDKFNFYLTGNLVLLGRMAENLVRNQMKGFGFAFISILIIISLIFRSVKMGLLAAVPNVLPILWVYGLMGFLGIELSSPTAMISSIVLGLVVDASIHFLHRFRLEFSRRHLYLPALHHTFRNVGQSLLVATLILCIGFASSIFASFRPTMYLGVLTGVSIFFALLCTLVVLPVCLVLLKPFGKQKLFAPSPPPSHVDTPLHV
jgi:hydrophobe/amphiphile efflux-3 (HAE3) family protein